MTSSPTRSPLRRRILQLSLAATAAMGPALSPWDSNPQTPGVASAHLAGQVQAAVPRPPSLPASTRLIYDLHRGAVSGKGELTWTVQGSRYEVRLEARVPVLGALLTQTSEGGLDAHGLAPARHTEKRIGRSERSVTFLRSGSAASGSITFSQGDPAQPLRPGAQDRVSWMPQLATLLKARGEAPAAGTTLAMDVASTSGTVRRWVFRMLDVSADGWIHLRREPQSAHDTRSEVWLDPRREFWPVKVRMADGEKEGDVLELVLRDVQAP